MDYLSKLKKTALEKEKKRAEARKVEETTGALSEQMAMSREVAGFLGVSIDEVDICCGSICPHCDMFLDKALALVVLGYKHHLFMNPAQEALFKEALAIYNHDPEKYKLRKRELMDKMR